MPAPRVVACPQCGRPVEWTAASCWRPFCSERCRLIDLGAWAAENYRVPAGAPSDPGEDDGTAQQQQEPETPPRPKE